MFFKMESTVQTEENSMENTVQTEENTMENTVQTEKNSMENLQELVKKNLYKVRDCTFYEEEYKECKSLRGRFHQYFVYGYFLDCSQWKEDFKNCEKSLESEDIDVKALASIIKHENERHKRRLSNHLANDVWKKREEPPPFWNAELPDWLKKKNENSFFNEENNDNEKQSCVLS